MAPIQVCQPRANWTISTKTTQDEISRTKKQEKVKAIKTVNEEEIFVRNFDKFNSPDRIICKSESKSKKSQKDFIIPDGSDFHALNLPRLKIVLAPRNRKPSATKM